MPKALGGQVRPYGVAISDALADPNTSLDQLHELRESGRRLLDQQGDLPGALRELEAEIERRSGGKAAAAGGVGILYGVVICDALDDPTTSRERLIELRDEGRRQLERHGDLADALRQLEAKIGGAG